jgi:hypothetical protein
MLQKDKAIVADELYHNRLLTANYDPISALVAQRADHNSVPKLRLEQADIFSRRPLTAQ